MSRISPTITESLPFEVGYQSYHRDDTQPLESPSSPMMVPIPHLFRNQKTTDGNNNSNLGKRMSDCGYPATAIKVDQPYQSFLNHPFTKLHQQQQQYTPPQDPNPQQQRPQAYINKYNSYTNSSKSIRLITIPSTSSALSSIEKSKMNNQMTALDSPTSPMVSPPPPYLHSDHGEARFSPDSKKQYQSHHQQTSSQHGLHQQPQWPSMMMLSSSAGVTTTAATVTRPKLARVLPPQAIPIVTSGLGISNLGRGPSSADATPLTATTPRPSQLMKMRMMDRNSVQMSEEYLETPAMQSSSAMSATVMGPMSLRTGSPSTYPGFWEEARLSKMHYVFLSFGLVMMGSAIWVLVMQVFLLEWALVMPAASLVLFGMQYGRYRWKRNRHYRQVKENGVASASAAVVAAAAAAAAQAQLSSSYSPRESDAYLEPHQPRSFYATPIPQHHVTFREEEDQQQQQQQQQFNQQAYKQPRVPQQQQSSKKYPQHNQFRPSSPTPMSASPSSSSLVSMSSLSSSSTYSSTSSSLSSMGYSKATVNCASPYYQNHQFLSPVDSPTTPPPAYFKKMELPEIGSVVGDLVNEFEVDFSSIKY